MANAKRFKSVRKICIEQQNTYKFLKESLISNTG